MAHDLTERARLALLFARQEAGDAGAGEVSSAHLLAGLLREDEGLAAELLTNHGVRLATVRTTYDDVVGEPVERPDPLPLSPAARWVLDRSEAEARWAEQPHVATEHVLLGLLHEAGGGVIRLLLDAGLTEASVRGELARRRSRRR